MVVRLAVLHIRLKLGYRRANMRKLNQAFMEARDVKGAEVILIPAYPLLGPVIGYYPEHKARHYLRSYAERLSGVKESHTISVISKLAASYGVEVIGGPIIERAGPRLYLTMFHIDNNGVLREKYRKVMVTTAEKEMGISAGKEAVVFKCENGLKLGVFIDEDLFSPEVFRYLQLEGPALLTGTMLPYESDYIKSKPLQGFEDIRTMDLEAVKSMLWSRALESGLPIVLVGGAVELPSTGTDIAFMPSMVADPEIGVTNKLIKGYDDLEEVFIVEVDPSVSKPKRCDESCLNMFKTLCLRELRKKRGIRV
jgi:predicted amidohydrolase